MDKKKRAVEIMENAERELVNLMELALYDMDYSTVSLIARLADRVRSIVPDLVPSAESADGHERAASRSRIKSGGNQTGGRRSYPRFVIDGDQIVKIGWSKKKRREYEQRATRPILDHVANEMLSLANDRRRFRTEDLLPLSDPDSGEQMPNYKAYLCLRFLRDIGLVKKHGRDGYSIVETDDFHRRVDESWGALPGRG